MVISREDYLLFMSLIEREIHELYFDRYHETEVIRERQQKLFEKWKELNHPNTTDGYTRFYDVAKEQNLRSWIVGTVR